MNQLLFISILLAGLMGCNQENGSKAIPPLMPKEVVNTPDISKKTDKELFYEAFEACKKYDKSPFVVNEISDIRNHETIVSMWALDLKSGKELKDKTLTKDIVAFENLLINVQMKAYPLWRKKYLTFKKQELFRYNVDVRKGGGNSYNVAQFINIDFANNAVIEDFNNDIWEDMKKLRFKKVMYSWNENSDRAVSYSPKSPLDNKLVY